MQLVDTKKLRNVKVNAMLRRVKPYRSKPDIMNSSTRIYDNNGNCVFAISDAHGRWVRFKYRNGDKISNIINNSGDFADYTYDDKGNNILIKYLDKYFEYTYDNKGNMLSCTSSYGSRDEYTYDDKGNKLSYKNTIGEITLYEYNDKNKLIAIRYHDGGHESYEYDDNGNMIYHKAADGRWEKNIYDDKGNKTSRITPGYNHYDDKGNKLERKTPCVIYLYEYDDKNNRIFTKVPNTNQVKGKVVIAHPSTIITEERIYNDDGLLLFVKNGRGIVTEAYQYESINSEDIDTIIEEYISAHAAKQQPV